MRFNVMADLLGKSEEREGTSVWNFGLEIAMVQLDTQLLFPKSSEHASPFNPLKSGPTSS